jgi:hypothetical protein
MRKQRPGPTPGTVPGRIPAGLVDHLVDHIRHFRQFSALENHRKRSRN